MKPTLRLLLRDSVKPAVPTCVLHRVKPMSLRVPLMCGRRCMLSLCLSGLTNGVNMLRTSVLSAVRTLDRSGLIMAPTMTGCRLSVMVVPWTCVIVVRVPLVLLMKGTCSLLKVMFLNRATIERLTALVATLALLERQKTASGTVTAYVGGP